jgi:hypothetical protein
VIKGPPRGHSGQLAPTKAVVLAVRSHCRYQTEEIKDDLLARSIVNAEGDKGLERIAGHVGVFVCRTGKSAAACNRKALE